MATMINTLLVAVALCAPATAAADGSLSAVAHSVRNSGDPVASSALVTSAASLLVVTAPIWLTAGAVTRLQDGSEQRRIADAARPLAGPLPPLTVTQVALQADGGVLAALQNPQSPDDLAVLAWPARTDGPAPTVKIGDVLNFIPTDAGAGWTVHAADGAVLGFVPTLNAAAVQSSERW